MKGNLPDTRPKRDMEKIMYAAISNFDVVISSSKKRARKYAKGLPYGCQHVTFIPRQVMTNPIEFVHRFGCANAHVLIDESNEVLIWGTTMRDHKWFLRKTLTRK